MKESTSTLVAEHLPCPCGKSSDAYATYSDSHGYCFGVCGGRYFHNDSGELMEQPEVKKVTRTWDKGLTYELKGRNLTKEVCEKYGIKAILKDNSKSIDRLLFEYCDASGTPVAQKVKRVGAGVTGYGWQGDHSKIRLFGQHLFGAGSTKFITLTEGELDAASAYHMLGSKWPVVSIPNGAQSALKACKDNYKYLDSFGTIIVNFDNDEPGNKAANEIAELFLGKARVLRLPDGKDANEYKQRNASSEYQAAWWKAEIIKPDNVVSGSDIWQRLIDKKRVTSIELPWEGLNKLTYGCRLSEMWTITSGSGMGKCLSFNTPVLLYNGSVKMSQDIHTGDLLMGPNSRPRKVLTTTKGTSKMYKVVPVKGTPYVVNGAHVLSLKKGRRNKGDLVNISVEEFLKLTPSQQKGLKGWRTGVDFKSTIVNPELDPYVVGLWLGDGHKQGFYFSNKDQEILDYLEGYAKVSDLKYSYNKNTLRVALTSKKGRPNYQYDLLKEYFIAPDKRIGPYLTSSRYERLQVLAGLVDSDGYLTSNCYEITQVRKELAEDILFLARSLGFAAYMTPKVVKGTTYYRTQISGEGLEKIPCLVRRKKAAIRKQIKDALVTGITVEPVGVGDYYGWELDGDHLFLLGDFTVTHNSQVLRELAYHFLSTTEWNVGGLILEESVEESAEGLMSIHAQKPLHIPTTEYSEEEYKEAFDKTLGTNRVFFYDHFGSTDIDNIIGIVKFLAKACECKVIFLDHISILVSDQHNADERRALDEIATKLKTLCMELDILLIMVSHSKRPAGKPHEEGGRTSLSELRGTAGIGQMSNIVLGLERDGQAEDLTLRNTTTLRVLKNRFSGLTGPACELHYDIDTGRMTEVLPPDPIEELVSEVEKEGVKDDQA